MLTTVAYQLSNDGSKQEVVYALEGSVAYAGLNVPLVRPAFLEIIDVNNAAIRFIHQDL